MKRLICVLLLVVPFAIIGQSLCSVQDNTVLFSKNLKKDSLHSSMILSVSYNLDTLYIKARHYAVCCEKIVNYIDKKENFSQINFVVKSLEKGCLCEIERIVTHKVFISNLNREIKFKLNGKKPNYGIVSFSNPNVEVMKKKKKNKRKMKEM